MAVEQERRRHERYPFERSLELHAPSPYGTIVVLAQDISESGFSFSSGVRLAVGDQIRLALRHDDDFHVVAQVRNVRRQGDCWVIGAERVRA